MDYEDKDRFNEKTGESAKLQISYAGWELLYSVFPEEMLAGTQKRPVRSI